MHPFVSNARIHETKEYLRKQMWEDIRPILETEGGGWNGLHAADDEIEAWEMIEAVLPGRLAGIREQYRELQEKERLPRRRKARRPKREPARSHPDPHRHIGPQILRAGGRARKPSVSKAGFGMRAGDTGKCRAVLVPARALLRFSESRKCSISLFLRISGRKAAAHFAGNALTPIPGQAARLPLALHPFDDLALGAMGKPGMKAGGEIVDVRDMRPDFLGLAGKPDDFRLQVLVHAVLLLAMRLARRDGRLPVTPAPMLTAPGSPG